jgi:3-deoxy-manno-octulosonate cytidylyltransferase (CMP-KDO synthetase)
VFRVVIPARYASSRLPGKALVAIAGKPMIQWVYERARASRAREVLIATDDLLIVSAAHSFGAEALMTAATHKSGTDRIAEVARLRGWSESDIVVNVQGDEPLIPAASIDQVAMVLESNAGTDVATLATPIGSIEEFMDPNAVKVVTDAQGRALYFSRAPIPWDAAIGLTSAKSARNV